MYKEAKDINSLLRLGARTYHQRSGKVQIFESIFCFIYFYIFVLLRMVSWLPNQSRILSHQDASIYRILSNDCHRPVPVKDHESICAKPICNALLTKGLQYTVCFCAATTKQQHQPTTPGTCILRVMLIKFPLAPGR